MAGLRSSARTYRDEMNIFKQIAQATGESVEDVCQMQEEERNNLICVLGIQQESGETKTVGVEEESEGPSKGGRKRKALQTFLGEKPNKKLNRDTTEGGDDVSLKRNSRGAARKAKLKMSEISKVLDSPNDLDTSNDSDQKIEDFDDVDLVENTCERKDDKKVINVVPQHAAVKEAATIFFNLNLKCPDLLKFVGKAEEILKEDLPELHLHEARRPKFEEGERKGEKHRRAVRSLTSNGSTQSKGTRRSWVKVKILKNKPRILHVTKDGTLGGRQSEEDEETGLFHGVKGDKKKLNFQIGSKNLFDDEDEPIFPTSSGSTFKFRKRPNNPRQIKKSFDFIDEDEDEEDETLSLFDRIKQGKKSQGGGNVQEAKKAVDDVKQSLAKSDDEIQFVKEVKSPQIPEGSRRPIRKASCEEEEKEEFPNKGKVACPLCNLYFSQDDVEDHAASCGAGG